MLKRVWVPYFSPLASGGRGKKYVTPALLQFHFSLEQTSDSIVEVHEVESLFTTDKLRNMLPPTMLQEKVLHTV